MSSTITQDNTKDTQERSFSWTQMSFIKTRTNLEFVFEACNFLFFFDKYCSWMKNDLRLICILSVYLHITNTLSCWVLVWRNKRLAASYFFGVKHPPPFPCYMEGHNCHVWPCHVRAYKDIISHCTQCFQGTGWCISLGNNVSTDKTCVPVCAFPWGCLYGRRYALVPFVPHSERTHGEAPYCCQSRHKDEAPTAFASSQEIGGNMAGVQTLLGKEVASYVGHTASNPLTVTQHT